MDKPYQPLLGDTPIEADLEDLLFKLKAQIRSIEKTLAHYRENPIEDNPMPIQTRRYDRVPLGEYNRRRREEKVQILKHRRRTAILWMDRLAWDLVEGRFRAPGYKLPTLSVCLSLTPQEFFRR